MMSRRNGLVHHDYVPIYCPPIVVDHTNRMLLSRKWHVLIQVVEPTHGMLDLTSLLLPYKQEKIVSYSFPDYM